MRTAPSGRDWPRPPAPSAYEAEVSQEEGESEVEEQLVLHAPRSIEHVAQLEGDREGPREEEALPQSGREFRRGPAVGRPDLFPEKEDSPVEEKRGVEMEHLLPEEVELPVDGAPGKLQRAQGREVSRELLE